MAELSHRKLWCVQPIPTQDQAFWTSLQSKYLLDEVILADIYAAREIMNTLGSMGSLDVADRIERLGTKAHHIPSFNRQLGIYLEIV